MTYQQELQEKIAIEYEKVECKNCSNTACTTQTFFSHRCVCEWNMKQSQELAKSIINLLADSGLVFVSEDQSFPSGIKAVEKTLKDRGWSKVIPIRKE